GLLARSVGEVGCPLAQRRSLFRLLSAARAGHSTAKKSASERAPHLSPQPPEIQGILVAASRREFQVASGAAVISSQAASSPKNCITTKCGNPGSISGAVSGSSL